MTAADEPAAGTLNGPAWAHRDGPCDDSCYGLTAASTPAPQQVAPEDAEGFLASMRAAAGATPLPAVVALPGAGGTVTPLDEHEDLWAALNRHTDRLAALEAGAESDLSYARRIRETAVAYAVPIVQSIVAQRGLDADAAGEQLRLLTVRLVALLAEPPTVEE